MAKNLTVLVQIIKMIVLRVFCSFAGTISSLLDHLPFSFISLSPVNSWPSSRCSIDIILQEMPFLIIPNMSVLLLHFLMVFPGGSDGKECAYKVGDLSWIPGSERSPGEGKGNPLQHSCLGNPMDKGNWCPQCHKESDTT